VKRFRAKTRFQPRSARDRRNTMQGRLISCLLLVVVCCAWRSAAQEGGNTTCRPTTLTSSAFCYGYVTFPVLSTWNDTLEDELAFSDASPGSDLCPYYVSQTYQCEKHFPRCYYVGNSTVNSTALLRLCESMCFLGKQWNSAACSNYGDLYFQIECLDLQYYSPGSPPECIYVGLDNSSKWTWQIVLVSVLCGVAGILILSFLYSRFKQWRLSKKIQSEEEHEAQMDAIREERRNSLNFKFQPNPVLPGSGSGGGGAGGGGGTIAQLPP